MASLANPYFHKKNLNEQAMVDKMMAESIQIMGRTYSYLPRHMQSEDILLGEDVFSSFDLSIPIEAYLVNATGFAGDKEMYQRFGLQINNSFQLVLNKGRWDKEVKKMFDGIVSNGEATFTIQDYIRPREGDLIYDALTKFLMEIKFVDHDTEFYQVGRNYNYTLSCEAFNYQNETIATGDVEIDAFNKFDQNVLSQQLLTEDGFALLLENGDSLLLDDVVLAEREVATDFSDSAKVKFTVVNPFDY